MLPWMSLSISRPLSSEPLRLMFEREHTLALLMLSCMHSLGLGLDLGNSLLLRSGEKERVHTSSYMGRRASEKKTDGLYST